MKKIKKFLTILLTIAMVVSLLPATAFAANNTATTMRLAKTQGTVAVTNATGKNVKQTGNMKLYNGYKVKTGAKSYAWISLDDTKVAKLDANSVMEVQKKGKSLTLYLSSGNMFFNVKDPLKSGETFSIKTSTMTTGIRGTSGCVRVISDRVTEVHLLTGQVQIYTEHPALGVSKSAVLQAGQKATSLIDWEAQAVSGEMAEIVIEKLENHEVCGVCSKEIAEDPELLERIKEEAPHLLPEQAAAEADERLAADEAKAEEKQEDIDQAVDQQVFPEDVDPYFEEVPSTGSSSGGGSSAVNPGAVRDVATWADLLDAVNDYNAGEDITRINLKGSIVAEGDLPELTENGPLTLYLGLDNTLTLNNTIINSTELTINNADGTIVGPGADLPVLENRGTLNIQDATINGNGAYGIQQTKATAELIVSGDVTFTNCYEAIDGDAGMISLHNPVFENITSYCVSVMEANLNLNGMTVTGNGDFETLVYNARGTVVVNGNIQAPFTAIINEIGTVRMTGGTITAGNVA
ncbi:MAG: FecR domain-containing protein, partial [Anaerotignum sp.]|nr:FecR domain-containing protein [Anaerotignum sp.]